MVGSRRWLAWFPRIKAGALLVALAALLTTCDTDSPVAPTDAPTFAISDAVHLGGNADFFFLPPLVPDPSAAESFDVGAFDGTHSPAVEICLMAGEVCDATQPSGFPIMFTMATGPGSQGF
jgi:hypothetical protein